jgi:hypothetical protein
MHQYVQKTPDDGSGDNQNHHQGIGGVPVLNTVHEAFDDPGFAQIGVFGMEMGIGQSDPENHHKQPATEKIPHDMLEVEKCE